MPKHALVVYNPKAGTAHDADMWLGAVAHALGERYVVTILPTIPNMELDAVFTTISDPLDLVVAAGGDGTIRYVLGAVANRKSELPVGIIPLGTGNQLARNLGIYEENILLDPLHESLKVIMNGKTMKIDLGLMNGEYFCVAAGAGPLSDAIIMPESKDKVNWKMLAYASSMIQNFAMPPVTFKITFADETFQVEAAGLFVTNIADLGMGKLSDTAELNDGLLDLIILNPAEFEDYIQLGFHFAGGFIGGAAPYYTRKVTYLEIEVLPVKTKLSKLQTFTHTVRGLFKPKDLKQTEEHEEIRAMIDGDPWGHTPMRIEVVPHAVNVLTPIHFANRQTLTTTAIPHVSALTETESAD